MYFTIAALELHNNFTVKSQVLQTNNVVPEDKEGRDEPTAEVRYFQLLVEGNVHPHSEEKEIRSRRRTV